MEKYHAAAFAVVFAALFIAGCAQNSSPKALYGNLVGTVSVGPLCPVEPCRNPLNFSSVYGKRLVIAYVAENHAKYKQVKLNQSRQYEMNLPPGRYIVDVTDANGNELGLAPSGRPAAGAARPQEVEITYGNTTVLDFDIDTGIR